MYPQVVILALLSLLAMPDQALPPEVAASTHLLLAGALRVLSAMKQQEEDVAAEVGGRGVICP